MEMDLNTALNKYVEMFDENFPLMLVNLSEDELIKAIEKCIHDKKPYSVQYDKENVY